MMPVTTMTRAPALAARLAAVTRRAADALLLVRNVERSVVALPGHRDEFRGLPGGPQAVLALAAREAGS